jgi:hypothetical protein
MLRRVFGSSEEHVDASVQAHDHVRGLHKESVGFEQSAAMPLV